MCAREEIIYAASVREALLEVVGSNGLRRTLAILPSRLLKEFRPLLPEGLLYEDVDDGEESKTLHGAAEICRKMAGYGFTRHSLLINLGGGSLTDLGGFAASIYMRGIDYINVPTTLLAMTDASCGGKTAVNFGGVKNLLGTFHAPVLTVICPDFLATLPSEELLSGYGEMLKTALLLGERQTRDMLGIDPLSLTPQDWTPYIRLCVEYKQSIVAEDPREAGVRKALNLGHTAGHAFEALSIAKGRAVAHGCAVACGLVTALVLSYMQVDFPSPLLHEVACYVRRVFPTVYFDCTDYDALLALMACDKKNLGDKNGINFTLLGDAGKPLIDRPQNKETILHALDITRDLLGI